MAKKVNKNVVGALTLLACAGVVIVGTATISALQHSDPSHWTTLGDQAAANRDWEQAKTYYYRAYNVTKDPKYLVDVGQMLYEHGEETQAYLAWNDAITQNANLVDAHSKIIDFWIDLAEIMKETPSWLRMREAANALLAVDKENAKGLYALGYTLIALSPEDGGNKRAGLDNIRRAAQLAPEVVQYSLAEAMYTLADGNAEEAERVLKRQVDRNTTPGEDAARVRYVYARFLGSLKRDEEAVKMFQAAEEFAGDKPKVLADAKSQHAQYWTAKWYNAASKGVKSAEVDANYGKAKGLLEESIKLDEEAFLPYMLLSELFGYRGDHAAAIEVLEARAAKAISREGIKARGYKLSLFLILIKGADECLAIVSKLNSKSPEYQQAIAKAEKFCQDADSEIPEVALGLHTLGKVRLAQGNELEAVRLMQAAREKYGAPNAQNGKLLAQLLLRQNQAGSARQVIEESLKDPAADSECDIIAAQVALGVNDAQAAVRYADKALAKIGNDRDALRIKVAALQQLGDVELAKAIGDQLAESSPADMMLQAQSLYRAGRADDAYKLLTRVLDQAPAQVDALGAAVEILLSRKDATGAMTLINRARAASPDRFEIKILEARADQSLSDEQRKEAILRVLKDIKDPFQRSYQLAMWYGENNRAEEYAASLAEAERHLVAPDSAIEVTMRRNYLRNIIERQFMYSVSKGDTAGIEAVVNKAVKENIDGADGLTYRGRAHMVAGKPDLALGSFKLALQKQPTDAQTLTYAGQCYMAISPPQVFEAKTSFERAVAANPNLGFAHKGLAAIARMNGNEEDFQARLAQCERLIPQDTWVQDQLQAKRELATPHEGIKRREEIRGREPANLENLISLADLYERTNQRDKSKECYEAVLAIPNVEARAIVASAAFFRKIGDAARGMDVLEKLVDRMEGKEKKAGAVLLIANHWYEQGNKEKAEEALKRAAELSETLDVCSAFARYKADTGDHVAAIEWYAKAIELADKSSPDMAANLRRDRIDAMFRANRPDDAQREVQQFIDKYPADPSGLIMRSAVATMSGDIDGAIEQLDRYIEQNPQDLNAKVQRAKLYFAQGRYVVAIRDLEEVRSSDPKFDNYKPRMKLADGYALTEKPNLAFDELESIIRDDPTARDVAIFLVKLYADKERYPDAIRICTSMSNRYPNEAVWIKNRADIRVRMKDNAAALADYELAARMSGYQPNYTASLLQAYAELGRADDGINYFTQTIPSELRSPQVVLRYAQLLAKAGRVDEAVPQFLTAFNEAGVGNLGFVHDLITAIVNSCGGEDSIERFRKEPANPRLKRAANHVAAILMNQFNHDSEALTLMQSLLQSATQDVEKVMLLGELGNVYERQQDWKSAKLSYEQLLKIDERNLLGLNNLAFLLSDKLGQPRDAIPYATRAAQLLPIPTVRDTLGWTHVQLNEYRTAISILGKVMEDNPRFVPAIYHLAEAYRRDGQIEKAGNLLEGAVALLKDGNGEEYREKIRKAVGDVNRRETAP